MNLEEAVAEVGRPCRPTVGPGRGLRSARTSRPRLPGNCRAFRRTLPAPPSCRVAYHINMRDPAAFFAARRFAMRDKDILFVSNSPSTELTKVLQMVDLVTSPVYSAGSVATSGASLAK